GIHCLKKDNPNIKYNYAYFPILVGEEYHLSRDELYYKMCNRGVHPRRYFYPLISEFSTYRELPSARGENLPVSSKASDKILCLPLHPDLTAEEQDLVVELIEGSAGHGVPDAK